MKVLRKVGNVISTELPHSASCISYVIQLSNIFLPDIGGEVRDNFGFGVKGNIYANNQYMLQRVDLSLEGWVNAN